MSHGKPSNNAAFYNIDCAPVREVWNGEVRDRRQRRFVIERPCQYRTGLSQKIACLLGAFTLVDVERRA
jgi:hypothetical protein